MKLKSLFVGISAILLLAACNSGGGTTSSDVQTGKSTVGSGSNQFTISSLTATGCKTISTNGSCTISFTYSGIGNYQGQLSINALSGYTSTITTSCYNTSSTSQTCNWTINNTGGNVNTAQTVTIYSNGQTVGINLFVVGGGL